MKKIIQGMLFIMVILVSPLPEHPANSQNPPAKQDDSLANNAPVDKNTTPLLPVPIVSPVVDSQKLVEYYSLIETRDRKVKKVVDLKKAADRRAAVQKLRAEEAEDQILILQDRIDSLENLLSERCNQVIISPSVQESAILQPATDSIPVVNKKNKKNIFVRVWKFIF